MDNFDNRPQTYGEIGIQSTAGAVPVKNDKGEISMQKVKVQRYISGKRPDYAVTREDSDEDSDGQDFINKRRGDRGSGRERERERERLYKRESSSSSDSDRSPSPARGPEDRSGHVNTDDPRLRRLLAARMQEKEDQESDEDEEERRERLRRRRRVQEPEVVEEMKFEDEDEAIDTKDNIIKEESDDESDDDSDSDDDEMDEETVTRRRELMRQRAIAKAQMGVKQEELLAKEEEKNEEDDEEESSEEETDSDEEEQEARLKPVFVRAKDRLTIQEREREEQKARQAEREAVRMAEERRRQSLRMVEAEVRKTQIAERKAEGDTIGFDDINTDDENDEVEYESWKVRELRRLKRDREEREAFVKEQAELERFRNLTEDEKRAEMKINPKQITNKASKGKYKFMQKYYHRGAFYMDEEENVLKRDVSHATLEDKFDKTVLPKVMQVKNFGRSGRTKYTHLVDQVIKDWCVQRLHDLISIYFPRIQLNSTLLGPKTPPPHRSSIEEQQEGLKTFSRNPEVKRIGIETTENESRAMSVCFVIVLKS